MSGPWRPRPGADDGSQLFVIGDVHGQAAALAAVLDGIAQVPRSADLRRLVFLGDLIDRGPDSLGAIALAMSAADGAAVDEVVLLPGNHELMLLDALDDPMRFMGDWLDNGGMAVIAEAGRPSPVRLLRDFAAIARDVIPETFLELLRRAPGHVLAGDLLLVHAGLNPQRPAAAFLAQPGRGVIGSDHWAWIRAPFLDWTGGWGPEGNWTVVHGHTPALSRRAAVAGLIRNGDRLRTHGRICLDAGAAHALEQVGWAEFVGGRYRLGLACR